MKRDLGKAAESKFVSWCSDVGITINKAEEDKHGWDFLLELPVDRATGSAFDLHKANMICKVQVKATEGKKLSRSVELSNLHALATDPLPVFYLFLHFDSGKNPTDAYLLHMDEDLISRVLKSARVHVSSGEGGRLHKKSLTLSYNKTHRLKCANGEGLLEFLEGNFFGRWGSLLAEKQKILATIGFEDGAGSISFTITDKDQRDALISGSLGYDSPISVSDFTVWHQRFGIKDPTPFIPPSIGELRLTNPSYQETRVMITSEAAETVILSAKVYFSPFINDFAKAIFRISTEYFDIRADAGARKIDIKTHISDDSLYPLVQLQKVLLLVEKTLGAHQSLSVFLEVDRKFLKIFDAHTNQVEQAYENLSVVASHLSKILKDSFELNSVSVSCNWLRDNAVAIIELAELKLGHGEFKLKFMPDNASVQDRPERAHFFHYRVVAMGGISYLFIFAASCERFTFSSGEDRFSGRFELIKELEGPDSDLWVEETLCALGKKLTDELISIGDAYCKGVWFDPSLDCELMIRTR